MPTQDPLVNWLVGLVIALVVGAWWDNKRQNNERHRDNVRRLDGIEAKLDQVNGNVGRHSTLLELHARELDRLRGGA